MIKRVSDSILNFKVIIKSAVLMKTKNFSVFPVMLFHLILILLFFPFSLSAQKEGTFKDSRDNRVYQWAKIGKKVWMAENLKYHTNIGSWFYNNDSVNQSTFGVLYDWSAASSSCPKGWHLPSDQEWDNLIKENGGSNLAAGNLVQADTANKNIRKKVSETGKTISTFLGGVRHADGAFTGQGIWGGFWSSTTTEDGAKNYLFARGDKAIGVSTNDKESGFSVRCVKK
jgi:uncharacterized protein (TIGR02145 family)